MDYEDMKDIDINKAVKSVLISNHKKESDFDKFFLKMLEGSNLNYCNSPADAWPIIDSIWSKLNSNMPRSYTSLWQHQIDLNGGNKLRAAMIVYLEMNKDKK